MNKLTILIVDDSISILTTLKTLIEASLNVEVVTAKSFKECATVFLQKKGKFDLVLADLSLPDAQNGEVVDFVAKFSIPIVVLTGSEHLDTENKFRNKNIVDYIIKDGLAALNYASSLVKRLLNNRNIKVLIVDDSDLFVNKVGDLLKRYNLQVLSAKDGVEALEILKDTPDIKLILTDYLMPNINGLELTKIVRKKFTKDELSIIVLSIDSDKRIPAKFLKYGANDFLYKNFSHEEFFSRINLNIEIIELFDEIKNKANKDYLTGLYNRRYLFDTGKQIYLEYKEKNKNLAIAILDIDNFKFINDNFGHDIGDIAIKEVSSILKNSIKSNVLLSRLGGEEFCILLFDETKEDVLILLEKVRNAFENNFIKSDDKVINYTVSIGCSFDFGKNFDHMIQNADKKLYDAKNEGKNRVRYR